MFRYFLILSEFFILQVKHKQKQISLIFLLKYKRKITASCSCIGKYEKNRWYDHQWDGGNISYAHM